MYKPEDLSTPTKRPTSGSGFIINNSKTIVLPDDQMDIDDDDDDPNEVVSDEDLRGMVLPTVVQSSLKQQMNRKTKQQQIEKDSRQEQDDEENNTDHEINPTRKKYQEKVRFGFLREFRFSFLLFRLVHRKVLKMHLKLVHFHQKWKRKFMIVEKR
jgi:hypothetical protein